MEKELLNILKGINSDITDAAKLDLLASGLIDSFDIATLVAELEATFQIEIDAEDIVPENFSRMQSMIDLVSRYKNKEK